MKQNIQTNFSDASNIFFTSDTHFSHENIMHFCNRPFETIEEMNDTLIENWNKVVNKDSIVFHLGDFAWGNNWMQFLNKLNGHKILIMGNHDFKNKDATALAKGFDYVCQQLYINVEHRKVILNHCPILCYGGTYRKDEDKVYQLFGHVHSGKYTNNALNKGLDYERLKILFPTQYNVGVDNNDFTPISWYDVNNKIQEQIKNNKNQYL